jgi:hypothetical protein
MRGYGCACGNPCDHGMRGVTGRILGPGMGSIMMVREPWTQSGLGELVPEGVDPWDTSRWTITEWAAAAGLVLSVVWVWNLTMKGK